jgi:hypothetical protein
MLIPGVPFAVAEVYQGSGRIYPYAELALAIFNIDRPILGRIQNDSVESHEIDLEVVTHICENFRMEGNTALCDVRVLDTPRGFMLRSILVDMDMQLHMRATGTVDEYGRVSDLKILFIDVGLSITP